MICEGVGKYNKFHSSPFGEGLFGNVGKDWEGEGNSISSTGEFLPNFDLKTMISTYTNDFSWKKNDPNSQNVEEFFQIARFL
jgi:hypothetical protein